MAVVDIKYKSAKDRKQQHLPDAQEPSVHIGIEKKRSATIGGIGSPTFAGSNPSPFGIDVVSKGRQRSMTQVPEKPHSSQTTHNRALVSSLGVSPSCPKCLTPLTSNLKHYAFPKKNP